MLNLAEAPIDYGTDPYLSEVMDGAVVGGDQPDDLAPPNTTRGLTDEEREFVLANMGLAIRIANQRDPKGTLTRQDLRQQALLGLCLASTDYDPAIGTVGAFGGRWISGEIGHAIRAERSLVHVPRNRETDTEANVIAEAIRIALESGQAITTSNLAMLSGLANEVINAELLRLSARKVASLDAALDETKTEVLGAKIVDPTDQFTVIDNRHVITSLLRILDPTLQKIVILSYLGDGDGRELNQTEVATRVGIAQSTVAKKLKKALQLMRAEADIEDAA